jgi:hypothetical protein
VLFVLLRVPKLIYLDDYLKYDLLQKMPGIIKVHKRERKAVNESTSHSFPVQRNDEENILFNSANADFASALVLWYTGFENNTATWLMMHTVEKYLKVYLMIRGKSKEELKNGFKHDIIKLKNEFDKINGTSFVDVELNRKIESFVAQLSKIKDDVRYGEANVFTSGEGLFLFVVLCSDLRYLILGKTEYSKHQAYGLMGLVNIPDHTAGQDISVGYRIVMKVLHLCLEHGISTDISGAFVPYMSFGLKSYPRNFAYLTHDNTKCPICSKSTYTYDELSHFYRDL